MGKLRQTALILGEGPTEFFYFKSLCDVFKRLTIKPDYPKHTNIKELEAKIAEGVTMGYSHIFCIIDMTRKGTTSHVDHANTFYQIPADGNGLPMVFLHGYGQSRTGWQSTPDGREGWADIFLKKGHPVFLVDQPRRGAAGSTVEMTKDALDADGTKYRPGEQAWYTHFRIGRVAPERYDGSHFPASQQSFATPMSSTTATCPTPTSSAPRPFAKAATSATFASSATRKAKFGNGRRVYDYLFLNDPKADCTVSG